MNYKITTSLLLGILPLISCLASDNNNLEVDNKDSSIYSKQSGIVLNKIDSKFYQCRERPSESKNFDGENTDNIVKTVQLDGFNKEGVLKKLDDEDWGSLLDLIKDVEKKDDCSVINAKDFEVIFYKLVLKYPSLTLFDFENDVYLLVSKFFSIMKKNVPYWKSNMDLEAIKLPNNANILLVMEKSNNTFMKQYFSLRDFLKVKFEKIQRSIQENPNDIVKINLKDFFHLLLNKDTVEEFKNFCTKLVADLGSTALPIFEHNRFKTDTKILSDKKQEKVKNEQEIIKGDHTKESGIINKENIENIKSKENQSTTGSIINEFTKQDSDTINENLKTEIQEIFDNDHNLSEAFKKNYRDIFGDNDE